MPLKSSLPDSEHTSFKHFSDDMCNKYQRCRCAPSEAETKLILDVMDPV